MEPVDSPIWDPQTFFAALAAAVGVPLLVIATVIAVLSIYQWITLGIAVARHGREAMQASSRGLSFLSQLSKRGGRQAIALAIAAQVALVLVVYLSSRAVLVMLGTLGGTYDDALSRIGAIFAPPEEVINWTTIPMMVIVGVLVVANGALLLRAELLSNLSLGLLALAALMLSWIGQLIALAAGFISAAVLILFAGTALAGATADVSGALGSGVSIILLSGFLVACYPLSWAASVTSSRAFFPSRPVEGPMNIWHWS